MMEKAQNEVYYKSYLALDQILNAQHRESEKAGKPADDEMLFIIIHQTYELWFKQILFELKIVQRIFANQQINDNAPDMQIAVHRLQRIATILRVLVHQIDILETMTPLDFLDFRDLLRPASGFQSYQFKMIEAIMGLKFEQRHEQNYYVSHLHKEELDEVKKAEQEKTLLVLVNQWLERMPFFDEPRFWKNYSGNRTSITDQHIFWNDYRALYDQSLSAEEKKNLEPFDSLLFDSNDPLRKDSSGEGRNLSGRANRSALFIMLYRDYPLMQLPFQLINTLLDIDELMALWRHRHISMVQRMIGSRIGTGGSSGKDYLRGAMEKHYIFKEFAELTSFLIERRRLPELSVELKQAMGYSFGK
ncbi:MAG TPA: tryptophan 2,3-dioxygenase family protein [Chitinophagales bacterium]|nr:tryptophan 2,3-dioxygenase family protein [Chitinophagales bacterium]